MLLRNSPAEPSPDVASPPSSGGARATNAALALVLGALLLLVLLPIAGERAERPLREEMRTVAEPGRGLVTQIQLNLALEGSALHDFLEAGDTSLVARYRRALAQERAAVEELAPLVRRLGPEVEARFGEMRALAATWHDAVDGFLAAGRGSAGADPLREELYEDLLIAAARLDGAIDVAAQSRRGRILEAERMRRRVTLALGVVAVAAIAAVAWLGVRVRAAARESERGRRELERVVESRARLMRGLGHDLKNPLNAIDGHASLLEDGIHGAVTAEQRASLGRVRGAVRSLLVLVDDLLELARAEAGQLRVAPRPVEMRELVRDVVEEHRAAAQAAGHRVECEPDRVTGVRTDPDRVRQVLGNLLSNAIKYTPPGGTITVRAATRADGLRGAGHAGPWAVIEVADTGPGIAPEQQARVFEEFTRLEPATKPGTGLGLSIARRVARLLGGDLTLESDAGRGATFVLWLPTHGGGR